MLKTDNTVNKKTVIKKFLKYIILFIAAKELKFTKEWWALN